MASPICASEVLVSGFYLAARNALDFMTGMQISKDNLPAGRTTQPTQVNDNQLILIMSPGELCRLKSIEVILQARPGAAHLSMNGAIHCAMNLPACTRHGGGSGQITPKP